MSSPFPDLELIRRHLDGRPARTRFAPSPTGYLHLGHVVNAIYVWGIAGALGGEVVLRMEDHDRQRSRPEYEAAILEDLAWLGLTPDLGQPADFAGPSPFRQSDNETLYAQALADLQTRAHVYACDCSRKDIQQRSGEASSEELRYDGHCRTRGLPIEPGHGLRLHLPDQAVRFRDLLAPAEADGLHTQLPARQCGDLLIRDRDQQWTYQYAVVADDLQQDIRLIIRGMDILSSTGRQLLLARFWQPGWEPLFLHHPLLTDPAGRKLSKRDFDADIHALNLAGTPPETVLGQAAHLAGLIPRERPLHAEELAALMQKGPR